MMERLLLVKLAPVRVLDAGCGSGADLPALQQTYPAAQIVGLDASGRRADGCPCRVAGARAR